MLAHPCAHTRATVYGPQLFSPLFPHTAMGLCALAHSCTPACAHPPPCALPHPLAHPHPVHVGTDPCMLAAWCALTLTHIVLHTHPPFAQPLGAHPGVSVRLHAHSPLHTHILAHTVHVGMDGIGHACTRCTPTPCHSPPCTWALLRARLHTHARPHTSPCTPTGDAGPSCGVPPDLINPNRPHWPSQSHQSRPHSTQLTPLTIPVPPVPTPHPLIDPNDYPSPDPIAPIAPNQPH